MTNPSAAPPERFRAAYLEACALDVLTAKPGNVSVQSPGHGMHAAQFVASAYVSRDALFARGARVGRRILDAVGRTRDAVGCNTNLGIVLLVAPLAAALDALATARAPLTAASWRDALQQALAALDIDDARLAYRAIALANPGGLGDAPEQSVHAPPSVGLVDAMRLAAGRDSIARQYANGFADLFDTGLAAYREACEQSSAAPDRAMLDVFLAFLGGSPDTHIVRKHGLALAQSVTHAARQQRARWRREGAAVGDAGLDAWDAQLKARSINPGTSADLAVATLFVARALDPALDTAADWHGTC